MAIRAVIFDLDGTITQPFFDFDAIRGPDGSDPRGRACMGSDAKDVAPKAAANRRDTVLS